MHVVCSLKEGFIVGGILLGYLASALWVGDTGGWRYMYGAALPPALLVFAGMVSRCLCLHESGQSLDQCWLALSDDVALVDGMPLMLIYCPEAQASVLACAAGNCKVKLDVLRPNIEHFRICRECSVHSKLRLS